MTARNLSNKSRDRIGFIILKYFTKKTKNRRAAREKIKLKVLGEMRRG